MDEEMYSLYPVEEVIPYYPYRIEWKFDHELELYVNPMYEINKEKKYLEKHSEIINGYKNEDPGVYMISCVKEDKIYVGSSSDIYARWKLHVLDLNFKKHHNYRLQEDWNKYGEREFSFEVLYEFDVTVTKNEILKKEQFFINKLSPEYNLLLKVDLVKQDYVPYNVIKNKQDWINRKIEERQSKKLEAKRRTKE